jgi:hypothetical protein
MGWRERAWNICWRVAKSIVAGLGEGAVCPGVSARRACGTQTHEAPAPHEQVDARPEPSNLLGHWNRDVGGRGRSPLIIGGTTGAEMIAGGPADR